MHRFVQFTEEERAAWERQAALVEAEWPEIEARMDLQKAAAEEDTFSGELRRAIRSIHSRGISLPRLFREAQVDWAMLDPFMHGEGELSSAVIDRLVKALGLHLQAETGVATTTPAESSHA